MTKLSVSSPAILPGTRKGVAAMAWADWDSELLPLDLLSVHVSDGVVVIQLVL